jgi:hypothetical protein
MDTFYLSRAVDGSKIVGDRDVRELQHALHEAATTDTPAPVT